VIHNPKISNLARHLFAMSPSPPGTDKQIKKCAGCGKDGVDLKNCGGCHSESYCSPACQKARWVAHKTICKEIQARIKQGTKGGVSSDVIGKGSSSSTAPLASAYVSTGIFNNCVEGQLEKLQNVLKQHKLDVHWAHPQSGRTAAHAAAEHGRDECLSLLIRHGANLMKRNKRGFAPIHSACPSGSISCLVLLLDHSIDVDLLTTGNEIMVSPSMICTAAGHVKCLAVLLDRGADLDLAQVDGFTCVHTACMSGQLKCLKLLFARGANINTKAAGGVSPLFLARQYGHLDCAEFLVDKVVLGESVGIIPPLEESTKVQLSARACLHTLIH
jgi:hypothetical protein